MPEPTEAERKGRLPGLYSPRGLGTCLRLTAGGTADTPGPRPVRRCWEPVGGRSEASLPRGSGSELEGEGNEVKASREEPGGLRGSGVGGPGGRPGRADWENQPGRRRREQAALPAQSAWRLLWWPEFVARRKR